MNRRRNAFTLVELLVVIGIIVLLLTILIPVVARLRLMQQVTSTTNQMHRISMSINNYFNDFGAYPGAFSNQQFATKAVAGKITGLANPALFTQTEDCAIGLLGGFQPDDANAGKVKWVFGDVGKGPMTYNSVNLAANKRYNAYMEYRVEDFAQRRAVGGAAQFTPFGSLDSEAPEFVDQFSSQRAIVYLRANIGNVKNDGKHSVYNSKGAAYDSTYHYDYYVMTPYLQFSAAKVEMRDFKLSSATAALTNDVLIPFTAGGISALNAAGASARNAGSYMLFDAGADGVFGTVDDIVIGSGGAQ